MNADNQDNYPENLNFAIQGSTFETKTQTNRKGATWWALVDEEGKPSGREIDPLSETLPTSLNVAGETLRFDTVKLKNPDGTTTEKPFDKTRVSKGSTTFNGINISFACRITRKKNGKWHLSFTAHQEKLKPRKNQTRFNSITSLKTKDDEVEIIELN